MQAQGHANQKKQYKFIKNLGTKTIKAIHKATGKLVVIKKVDKSD